jgi:S1-C subfamily serine protease
LNVKLPAAIENIRPAVIQVGLLRLEPPAQPVRLPLGTGFLVTDDGWFITAKHVIDDANKLIEENPTLELLPIAAYPGTNTDVPIKRRATFFSGNTEVMAMDDANDLALMRTWPPKNVPSLTVGMVGSPPITDPLRPAAASISVDRPIEGSTVAVSGYPLAEAAMVTNAGHVASSWAMDGIYDRYLGDLTANPGNSGGPVYRLSDGKVIGVCRAGKLAPVVGGEGHYAADITVIVPSTYVVALMESKGLTPKERPSDNS